MFARRRALVAASRLTIARPRAVAPFVRYSTESTSASTSTSTTTQPATPTPPSAPAQSSSEKPASTNNASAADASPSETSSSTPSQTSGGPTLSEIAASIGEAAKATNASSKTNKTPVSRLKPRAKAIPSKAAARPVVKPAPKPAFSATVEKMVPMDARYTPTPPPSDTTEMFNHVPINAPASLSEGQASGQLPDTNWQTSFHGASAQPVTEEQFHILMRPLKQGDIEIKPDGVIYLPEIKYRRRLNEAFGPMGWCLIPRGEPVVGESIVTREYALIINGRFVAQAQGENNYFGTDQLPSAVEGCKSNALMRCCKDLGIASELWDPIYLRWFKKKFMKEVWVEHQVTKKRRTLWFHINQVEVSYPYKQV